MARVGTPKEKIEKNNNSQSNCTYEIPFRVHQTFSLLNSLKTPVPLPAISEGNASRLTLKFFIYQIRLSPSPEPSSSRARDF
jgi:hypothetical protein